MGYAILLRSISGRMYLAQTGISSPVLAQERRVIHWMMATTNKLAGLDGLPYCDAVVIPDSEVPPADKLDGQTPSGRP